MSAESDKGKQLPLRNKEGSIVYGSGLPGEIWKNFMNEYHAKVATKIEPFGDFEPIGDDFRGDGDNGDDGDQQDEDRDDNDDNDKPSRDEETRPDGPGNGETDTSDPDEPTDTQSSEPEFPEPSFPLGNGRPGNG